MVVTEIDICGSDKMEERFSIKDFNGTIRNHLQGDQEHFKDEWGIEVLAKKNKEIIARETIGTCLLP